MPKASSPLLQELKSDLTVEEADDWLHQVPCCCVHRDHGLRQRKGGTCVAGRSEVTLASCEHDKDVL